MSDFGTNHEHCWIVKVDENVEIYERWNEDIDEITDGDVLRLVLPLEKWKAVKQALQGTFNKQLKNDKRKTGRFGTFTKVENMLGKEMMVLLWGIEYANIEDIPRAIVNWCGFVPEERWWLYMMTNAASGGLYEKKGWRTALKYILIENPVSEVYVYDNKTA